MEVKSIYSINQFYMVLISFFPYLYFWYAEETRNRNIIIKKKQMTLLITQLLSITYS